MWTVPPNFVDDDIVEENQVQRLSVAGNTGALPSSLFHLPSMEDVSIWTSLRFSFISRSWPCVNGRTTNTFPILPRMTVWPRSSSSSLFLSQISSTFPLQNVIAWLPSCTLRSLEISVDPDHYPDDLLYQGLLDHCSNSLTDLQLSIGSQCMFCLSLSSTLHLNLSLVFRWSFVGEERLGESSGINHLRFSLSTVERITFYAKMKFSISDSGDHRPGCQIYSPIPAIEHAHEDDFLPEIKTPQARFLSHHSWSPPTSSPCRSYMVPSCPSCGRIPLSLASSSMSRSLMISAHGMDIEISLLTSYLTHWRSQRC